MTASKAGQKSISALIRERIRGTGSRFHANDNIAEHIHGLVARLIERHGVDGVNVAPCT